MYECDNTPFHIRLWCGVVFGCAVLFAAFLALLPVMFVEGKMPAKVEKRIGYIYLGDSRFVGMNKYCNIDEEDDTWIVAEVGKGLNWMKKTAIPEIEDIVKDNPKVTDWVLITGLGVNDLYNIDKYIEEYDSLEGFKIILVSINPMEKDKADKWGYDYNGLSPKIIDFNDRLQDTSYEYIDVYTSLIENGFTTVDGLHYNEKTYKYIYDIINSYVKGGEDEDELSGLQRGTDKWKGSMARSSDKK